MIKMSEQKDMAGEKTVSGGGFNINPVDIVMYLLSRWYWFVLSICVFGGYAWYQYAKTQRVYSRSATVMFKDAARNNAGLDRLRTYTPTTNVSNEILQFKSHKLMRDVIERLHADVCYVVMDGLREKELYTEAPVKVTCAEPEKQRLFSMTVTPLNKKTVKLSDFSEGTDSRALIAPLGKTVKTPVGNITISPTLNYTEKWFDSPVTVRKESPDNMASHFLGNLNISQAEDDASILYLSLRDYSTQRAEDVLNMLITVYNEETIKDKNQIAINTTNFVNERLTIIEKELGGVESKLESYKKANNMIDINSTASTSLSEKQSFGNEADNLQIQVRMARYIKDYLTDPAKATELIPSNTGIANMDIESQITLYNANKLKRDKLLESSSDQNPVVEELTKNLNAMRQNIIRAVDNLIVAIDVKLNAARNRAGQAQMRVANIPTQQRQMLSIERQQRIKEELYLYLLNKREESALSQASTETDARVLDPAAGSDNPVSPNGRMMIMAGVMKGLALPAVVLLLLLFFDTRIRNRKDIEDSISVPFLGEIPTDSSQKGLHIKGHSDDKQIVVRSQGRDIVSEAFRIIRTNMDFMRVKSKNMQVITFSSFGPGAGKTYVSSNLAASFAQTNKKVILIDLDIRKGTLSSHVHHKDKGMTSYLAGNASVEEIIKKDAICENLDFIPAGPVAPNPSELLLSEQLEAMIAELRKQYDYIFVDNVPVGIVADAAITNRIADLTIFVVRVGKLDRRMLPELEKIYHSGQLKNMSLILNGAVVKRSGYGSYGGYSYGYGYGYGYDKDERPRWKKLLGIGK